MKKNVLFVSLFFFFASSFGQTGIPVPPMTQCDAQFQQLLNTYNIPGATLAMAKEGKIVYMRAFGYQDVARTIQTTAFNNSKADVQLIDVTGKIVLHQTLANAITHIDISKLASGTYTVKIISDKIITVQKFTKL